MKIAFLQWTPKILDFRYNIGRIKSYIEEAKQEDVELLILPELSDHGYNLTSPLHYKELEVERNNIVSFLKGSNIKIILPGIEFNGDRFYNSLYLIDSSKIEVVYRKIHLFHGEKNLFTRGDRLEVFRVDEWRILPHICYDLRFPELTRYIVADSYDLIIVPAAWPLSRASHWRALLKARAIENQVYVCGVNQCGCPKEIAFAGASCLVDPLGNRVLEADCSEKLHILSISKCMVDSVKEEFPILKDRRVTLSFN